jgi:hypothetical protein
VSALPYAPTRAMLRDALLAEGERLTREAEACSFRVQRADTRREVLHERAAREFHLRAALVCMQRLAQLGQETNDERAEARARVEATRCQKCGVFPGCACPIALEGGLCSRRSA